MMQLEEFANAVLAAVREKADGTFSVWLTTNIKNNGVKVLGVSTVSQDSNGSPCINLNGYYKEYRNGRLEIGEAAEIVYRQLMEHRDDLQDINTADFLQWDVIKYHIYAKLVNAEMNREALKIIPHRHLLDLAVAYYIKVDGNAEVGGMLSILIQNNYMEMWGQDEESLYQMAVSNMRSDGEPHFMDMETLLCGIMPDGINPFECEEAVDVKMYVLTNGKRTFGAAELLDANTLRGISEKLADDFIVLPSSVHEIIILPSDHAPEYTELAGMVCEVNATQVDAEDRLSDHVYRYDRNEGILKIAA